MTKKILPILIMGIMILSGLGAGIISIAEDTNNDNTNIDTKTININVADPTFTEQNDFTTIDLEQSEAYISRTGEPMLPVITKTFSFPIGTRINDVTIDIEWQQYHLDKKITPTLIIPYAVEIDPTELEKLKINEDIYSSTKLYPSEPYKIKYGAGLEDMEHVIFVNINCFPQYSPANDDIKIPKNIDINIEYETSNLPEKSEETYDLIIITHDTFEDELQPLVAHKESHGITTKLITVDEIYENYDGVADWEDVKMYLADHVLKWDTKFVLLAGGHIGQTYDWYVPDFRSHCWDLLSSYDPPYDETYSSDLYYADVYMTNSRGEIFMDTWNSNMNDIYAEGPDSETGTDNMDFYPDVHLGRLPIRYEWEADIAVDKIINYENNDAGTWFKKAVLAGGDCFPPERYGGIAKAEFWEGEIVQDVCAELLTSRDVEVTKCYCSDQGDIQAKDSDDIYNLISKGCGFASLVGHSGPFILGSYEPGTGISPPPLIPFYSGFNAIQFDCGYELPFMVNDGCHNAQFDVTTQELIDSICGIHPNFRFGRDEWIPHDVSSWFVLQKGGGAIAVIGNTALGAGGLNDGCTKFVGGWIVIRFIEAWAVDHKEYTGSVWTTGINGYIDNFNVAEDAGDRKNIEERVLLGDPSVKLGGYGSSLSDPEKPDAEENYGPVSSPVPTWSVGDSWTYALDNIDIDLSPTEDRAVTLKLSSGDIILEVTEVTDDTYVTSLTTDNIDVTFSGLFNFHIEDVEDIAISTMSFDNIQIDAQLILDKETLGINTADIGLIINLAENLENLGDIMGMEFPPLIEKLATRLSIPLRIDLGIEFDNPLELLQFPLENNKEWGIPSNTVTVTIDGSVQSIWLRVLNIVNKFTHIIPPELAQYLPDVDISDVLNDLGINTTYEIDITVPIDIMDSPMFEVWGSESISVGAGTFNAAKISIVENNANIYYSEGTNNIIKITGYASKYIPLIDDINLELIE